MPSADSSVGAINGISGGYEGHNENVFRAMMAFTAIAWYNAIELLVLIFLLFRKYSGLYFWTMLIASFSIIPYSLGAWMKQVQLVSIKFLPVSFSTFGWMFMVTSQSLVLYSRLHLVTENKKLLRAVLWLIVIDSILLYPPTAVLTYGSQTDQKYDYVQGYNIMEKIQMTWFTVQEFIISGIYLWEVHKILKVVYEGKTRKLMWELASINIAIIALGIALLTVEYLNYYQIETTLKGMVYSIKLKLEFGVLSKLVKIVTNSADPAHFGSTARMNSELGLAEAGGSNDEEKLDDLLPMASFSLSSWINSSRTSSSKILSPSSGSRFSSPKVFSKVPSRSSGYKPSKHASKFPSDSSGDKNSTPHRKQQAYWGSSSSDETTLPSPPSLKEESDVLPDIINCPAAVAERQRPDRRCSVEKMYPGRLNPDP